MSYDLNGMRVAVLATDGFEASELFEPVSALKEAGADVDIIAPESGSIRGWADGDWGDSIDVDHTVDSVDSEAYRALVLPGGVMNPDNLRTNDEAVRFTREFFDEGKPVAAICHGPWLLVEADVLEGREVTSWPSIRTDLRNAGATVHDDEVVVDEGLVTSRKPEDLPAFIDKMLEEIAEGVHAGQTA